MEKHYCPFCKEYLEFIPYGTEKRPHARCPQCGSFERTRLLFFIYKKLNISGNVLHISPERSVYYLMKKNKDVHYTCCDLHPELYAFATDCKKENGMSMSFADDQFDFVIHNQVIEHVPDDKLFILECLRVLKPNGKLIINLPYDPYSSSIPSNEQLTPQERAELFYQEDHLRLYGYDYLKTLSDKRWNIEAIDTNIFSEDEIREMRLKRYVGLQDAYVVITQRS